MAHSSSEHTRSQLARERNGLVGERGWRGERSWWGAWCGGSAILVPASLRITSEMLQWGWLTAASAGFSASTWKKVRRPGRRPPLAQALPPVASSGCAVPWETVLTPGPGDLMWVPNPLSWFSNSAPDCFHLLCTLLHLIMASL